MKILIDFNHPAHVHLFKNFITETQGRKNRFMLIARDKECTTQLLDHYGFDYIKRKGYRGIKKIAGLATINSKILKIAKKFDPDIMIGGVGNCYIAQVGWFLRKRTFIFDDTEHSKVQNLLTFPFATKIFTPKSYELDLGKKQVRYDGFHELFYLHPDVFKPDPAVLSEVGLKKKDKFAIVRFVDWQASHDIGDFGIKNKKNLIRDIEDRGYKVLMSSEKETDKELEKYRYKLHPAKLHSLMAFSSLFVGESATMASESVVLGIPAIFIGQTSRGYINNHVKNGYMIWRKKIRKSDLGSSFKKMDIPDYLNMVDIIK